jgi:NAD dependent epimerase/dehydratase family
MRLVVTGGTGFIGSAVVGRAVRDGHTVSTVDKLTMPVACRRLTRSARHRSITFSKPTSRTTVRLRRHSPTSSPMRCCISPPKVTSTGRSTIQMLSSQRMCRASSSCSRRGCVIGRDGATSSLCAHIDRRGVRRTQRRRLLRPREPLCAQLALCRKQGRGRSSGTSVAAGLWTAGHRYQLLEQLWAAAACREIHKRRPLLIVHISFKCLKTKYLDSASQTEGLDRDEIGFAFNCMFRH